MEGRRTTNTAQKCISDSTQNCVSLVTNFVSDTFNE